MTPAPDTKKAPQLFAAVPGNVASTEEHARSLLEAAGIGTAWMDLDGIIFASNPALQELLGLAPEELVGQPFSELGLRDEAEAERARFQELVATKQTEYFEAEKKLPRGDDEPLLVSWRVSLLQGAHGEPLHAVLVVQDVTERQEAEERLRQAQKLEAVGRLVGGVAHHFNNALAVINGYAEVLLQGEALGERERTFVDEIRKAGQQAASLTRQLLVFGSAKPLEPPLLDLNAVLSQLDDSLRRQVGDQVELVLELAPNLGTVRADPREMGQVIQNLVANGRDAMPNGGTVTVETINVELAGAYSQRHDVAPGPYVLLQVSDTGIGMDRTTLSHIFEPFFTTKEIGQGTGLGLATVYGIVHHQSKGHISVTSELGKGTTCKIYLPRIEEEAAPAEAAPPRRGAPALSKADFMRRDGGTG